MFMRIDQLLIELQKAIKPEPDEVAALQKLLCGKIDEIYTLRDHVFQSFDFRDKEKQ
ncbi:hypothetical protein HCU64_24895 [Methylobacterium sp. C25]|uniref:manganese catalase family protein n=1 Tax=Methylobacterium sp. C25 TaxID=2721622 RepID=UPI001F3D01DA|nr:manganese catalase family protein [Methylobacterium sp. C25]MCE4226978.1 hypothetical protein [Methylobacterium sp. C25]